MPQATDELREEWDGPDDQKAMGFLRDAGYVLNRDWTWSSPEGREPTEKEWSAIDFMFQEWDFGGWAGRERPASQPQRRG